MRYEEIKNEFEFIPYQSKNSPIDEVKQKRKIKEVLADLKGKVIWEGNLQEMRNKNG